MMIPAALRWLMIGPFVLGAGRLPIHWSIARRLVHSSCAFGFASLEPGDRFDTGAGYLGDELVAVVDAEGDVGGFDGERCSEVDEANMDTLAGDDQGSLAAGAAFNPYRF
ncbi:hypothetical protein AB0J94_12135 [Micromonospora noduli]|uniref:Uncharacterized protein n=1 Tax=Micromonospora noduli TaxID=709876 RepID=A0A328NA14_9ACTN|nr:hypothetical protein [Micromonospora noduli]RAO02823.1 hypothetical protein LAH08_02334 [Micromonospora noduli]RAO09919.1 hypothetical protein MED15_06211 [Micromonospora noduli]RAO10104.1 hypothetical protein LUPAC07_05316 [Micromonospora noduli]RAO15404.1 hypothetical protein GUI43_01737 [Micromonospora noduli]RAO29052.1 hypothetical protein ONO86_05827 [Micromonospora noduli]